MTTPCKQDNAEGSMNSTPPKERRRSPRAKIAPNEIVYLNFPSGNGGVVLDVSSAGVGFQTADPLERVDSLSFLLSAPAIKNIGVIRAIGVARPDGEKGRSTAEPFAGRGTVGDPDVAPQVLIYCARRRTTQGAKIDPVSQNTKPVTFRATPEPVSAAGGGGVPAALLRDPCGFDTPGGSQNCERARSRLKSNGFCR